jgi:hypothetical protein
MRPRKPLRDGGKCISRGVAAAHPSTSSLSVSPAFPTAALIKSRRRGKHKQPHNNTEQSTRAQTNMSTAATKKVRIGVLALQGSFAEHCAHVRRAGGEAIEVRKAEQLAGCSGLIIPGGESTTMANIARRWNLFEPLRGSVEHCLPWVPDWLLGLPAVGHQLVF